jgi:hypothetical protein
MLHPHTELRFVDDVIGYGVFATRPLPAGTITWALDALDLVLDDAAVAALGPTYAGVLDRYTYLDRDGHHVLCWDTAKYMNHHCEATCMSPGLDFEIALRHIEPGEQLTTDYASLNLEEDFTCSCASPHCRRVVRPGDWDRLAGEWDSRLSAAFGGIRTAPQPLWKWLSEGDVSAIDAGSKDPSRVPSILRHRFQPAGLARPVRVA